MILLRYPKILTLLLKGYCVVTDLLKPLIGLTKYEKRKKGGGGKFVQYEYIPLIKRQYWLFNRLLQRNLSRSR